MLNIKMEIADNQGEGKPLPVKLEQKEERSIEQLIEAELLLNPSEIVKQSPIEGEEIKQYH